MVFVDLVAFLALLQFIGFSFVCGRARGRYKVEAPATTGHPIFERYYRVQMNTLELLVVFLPALYIAARYWNPVWCAVIGVLFLIGRTIYFQAYVKEPSSRSLGYGLSALPIMVLIVGALIGMIRTLVS